MDFDRSESQQEIAELARRILSDATTHERLREVDASGAGFDAELWRALGRANLLGLAIGPDLGGMGLGFVELCLLVEEVGRAAVSLPVIPALVGAAAALQAFGSDEQRSRWLPRVAAGEVLLSAALAEPSSEDPSCPETLATREGDDWRVEGAKACVPIADGAERILLAARTLDGPVVLLLDPRASGVHLEPVETTARESQASLELSGARVACGDVLAGPERGPVVLEWVVQHTTAALCALQVGCCETALRMTADHTAQREQFGVPIATFQAVAHQAADRHIDIECLRAVTQQAVWLLAEGKPAAEAVAIAKIWAGDVGHRVSQTSQQLHGGLGVDLDYPLHRFCLRCKQNELTLGSSAVHLERLGERIALQGVRID